MGSTTLSRTPAASTGSSGAVRTQERPESESRIDRDSHFNGLYETKQNLRIEGLAEGEIQCEGTLTVAEGASVKAKVTASTITIAGQLNGEVVCRGVFQIMPSGEVDATVSARRLIVQEGGLYNGEFHMITDEAAEPSRSRASSKSDGSRSSRERAAATAPEDVVGSDEWWAKIAGKETPADVQSDDESPQTS